MLFHYQIQELLVLVPALLLSLTVHEFAHARVALAFGDPTAKYMGRVSLNPLVHLDPIGTLALFLVGFGWAKPVPVNPLNLHPRGLGDIMVSLAGPASNFLMAIVCGLILRVMIAFGGAATVISRVLLATMVINIILCVFNLIPLFPLDGHHILREMLPPLSQQSYMAWQIRYGRYVLLAMIFVPRLLSNVTGRPVFNPIDWVFNLAHHFALILLTV